MPFYLENNKSITFCHSSILKTKYIIIEFAKSNVDKSAPYFYIIVHYCTIHYCTYEHKARRTSFHLTVNSQV